MSETRSMVPPNSLEAERAVLGAMLQDTQAVLQGVERLTKDDFYQPQHKEIFDAMLTLNRNASPIDVITLVAELKRRGTLEGVGGEEYLADLISFHFLTANVKSHIAIVEEKSTLRKLISACQEISRECYGQMVPMQDALAHAEKSIFDIVMKRSSGETLVPMQDVLYNTYGIIAFTGFP